MPDTWLPFSIDATTLKPPDSPGGGGEVPLPPTSQKRKLRPRTWPRLPKVSQEAYVVLGEGAVWPEFGKAWPRLWMAEEGGTWLFIPSW